MSKKRVLVVEDETVIAKGISRTLSGLGYEALGEVATGEEALQIVSELRPDFVIMDIQLAGAMNGIETVTHLHKQYDIPVIYLTAYAESPLLQQAQITEPYGYLVKPFRERELHAAVEIALYRHQQEHLLKQSEERYRVVSELSSDFAFSIGVEADTSLKLEWITESIKQVGGIAAAEANVENLLSLLHPEDWQIYNSVKQTFLKGQSVEDELRIIARDGETRWLHVRCQPIWDQAQKRLTRVFGAAQDITARVQARQALLRAYDDLEQRVQERTVELRNANEQLFTAKQRYEDLVNSLDGIVWEADASTFRFTFVNQQAERLLGYPLAQWLEQPDFWVQHLHPADRDWAPAFCAQQTRQGVDHSFEYRMIAADGRIIWFHDVIAVIRETGVPTRLNGVMVDITRRKEIEEETKRSHQREERISALLQIAMQDSALTDQLDQALTVILSAPWLPVTKQGGIFLVEEDAEFLMLKVQQGLPASQKVTCAHLPIGACLCGLAAKNGEIIYAADIDERHEITYEGVTPHGHYCVPILSGNRVLGTLLLYLLAGHQRDERDEEFLQAVTHILAGMIERKRAQEALQRAHDELEARVQERTAQLRLAAEISRSTSTILDPSHLIEDAVNLIRNSFDLYHVGLFLKNEAGDRLVLRAGAGEGGKEMIREGFWLPVEESSLIGWSAVHMQRRLVNNVSQESLFLYNPRTPETRSEAIFPLVNRGQCIGVLDFHSRQLAAFSEESTSPIQIIADQLAVAVQNAYLFASAQKEIEERIAAERALRESEEKFHNVLLQSQDGIILTDENGLVIEWNQAMEKITLLDAEQALGQPLWKIQNGLNLPERRIPEIQRRIETSIRSALATGQAAWLGKLRVEECQRSDGHHYFLQSMLFPIKTAMGFMLGSMNRDITESIRANQALAWEANVNASMAELSRALISISSLDKVADLVLEHAKRLTGSAFGFVGYLDPESGALISTTMTRDIWDTCQVAEKTVVFHTFKGLWGWVLNNRRSLLTNQPFKDERSTGAPEGHIPIQRFLSAPAMLGEDMVGQIALANPERDYTEQDLALLERLASLYALAVQQRRSEQALRDSEARFRNLLELAPDAVVLVDEDGSIRLVNAQAEVMFGYTRQEMLSQSIEMLVPEVSRRKHVGERAAFMANPHTRPMGSGLDIWVRRKDGATFPADIKLSPVQIAQRYFTTAIIRDITERVQQEERLRLQSAALESAANAITIVDRSGQIIWINPAFTRLTGYTAEEAVGQNPRVLKSGQHELGFYQHLWETILSGNTWRNELINRRKDGSVYAEEMTITPVHNKGKEISHFIAIKQDITARKEAEEALRNYAGEQASLYAVTSVATQFLNPDEMLNAVLDIVLSIPNISADAAWATLIDEKSDLPPQIPAWRGIPDSLVITGIAVGCHGCPLCISASSDDEPISDLRTFSDCQRRTGKLLLDVGLNYFIPLPLSVSRRVIGVLHIAWRNQPQYTAAIHNLLINIGRQVALALRNAQLFEAEKQQRQFAETLRQAGNVLSASLDVNTVMDRIFDLIARVVPYDMAAIFEVKEGYIRTLRSRSNQRLGAEIEQLIQNLNLEIAAIPNLKRMAETGQPYCIPDAWTDVNWVWIEALKSIRSAVGAPVIYDGQVIALLTLDAAEPKAYTQEHAQRLAAFADQAALALRNAQLYQAARQVDRLQAIHTIGAAASASLELKTILRQVLELTCKFLDATKGSILFRDDKTGDLFFSATLSEEGAYLHGLRLPVGVGFAGWVAEHGQPIFVNDVSQDARWYSGIDELIQYQTHSLVAAPLIYHGKTTGVIEVINKREASFDEEDASLLMAVAALVAAAVENARLFSATRERADEQELLYQLGLSLSSTLDYTELVKNALPQIQKLFQSDVIALMHADPQTGEIGFLSVLEGTRSLEIPLRFAPGEEIVGWVFQSRQAVLVNDAPNDPRPSRRVADFLGWEPGSLLLAPLLLPERVIAVIAIASKRVAGFTLENLHLLQAVASTLAVALENAQLYEDLKKLLHERERAQAYLIQTEKTAALGRLAASIAHEINNPLQAVQGCLSLFGEEMNAEKRPEKLDRYMNIVNSEIDRIAIIVRRMRDFYRPAVEARSQTNIHVLLDSVLDLTAKQLQQQNIRVERDWAAELPVIQVNPDHFKQVFLNLVLNAVDAMPSGGILRIITSQDWLELPNTPRQPAVRIDFHDTGAGLPPDVLERLFEPFFTTKPQGSGLGLYISHGIVTAHGGQITVASQPGQGSTFTILLPLGE